MSDTEGRLDRSARTAGALLLLTAAATVVMVYARVSADADQPTLVESLRAIAENRAMYGASATARFVSGIALLAAAWYLSRTWIIRDGLGTALVPYLLAVSGIVTAVSGACAGVLAVYQMPEADRGERRRGLRGPISVGGDFHTPRAHRQDRVRGRRDRPARRGPVSVAGRRRPEVDRPSVGGHRHHDAANLDRRRNDHAPDRRDRLLTVARGHGDDALRGPRRAAFHGEVRPVPQPHRKVMTGYGVGGRLLWRPVKRPHPPMLS